MSGMRATCLITIRPHITPDGVHRLADAVVNKLWPDNAGGVVLLYHQRAVKALAPIAYECTRRNQSVELRAIRQGMHITVEAAKP